MSFSLKSFFFVCTIGIVATTLGYVSFVVLRRYGVVDSPNPRSSHSMPTVRGGGIMIVAVTLGTILALTIDGLLTSRAAFGLFIPAAIVAAMGVTDDVRGLTAPTRLLIQFAAAVTAVLLVAPAGDPSASATVLIIGYIVAIVWLTNLYNFMDGIDGIAGSTCVVAGMFGALFSLLHADLTLAAIYSALALASLAFLHLNWPPARMFMGDVGSAFIGFVLAILAIYALHRDAVPLWISLAPLAPFIFDATITLLRRIAHGLPPMTAHRDHAYQRAVQSGYSHGSVALAAASASAAFGAAATAVEWRAPWGGVAMAALVLALALTYGYIEMRHPFRPTGDSRGRS